MKYSEAIIEKIKKGRENAMALRVEEDGTVMLRTAGGMYVVEKAFIHFKVEDFELSIASGKAIEEPVVILLDEKKDEARCAVLNEKADEIASSASETFEGLILLVILKGGKKFTVKAIWSKLDVGYVANMLVDNDEASIACNFGLAEILAKKLTEGDIL